MPIGCPPPYPSHAACTYPHVGSLPHHPQVPPQRGRCPLGGSFGPMLGASTPIHPFFSTASMAHASIERAYARWARSLST